MQTEVGCANLQCVPSPKQMKLRIGFGFMHWLILNPN